MDLVVSTVDTDQTRRDIQWDLPRIILDAASVGTEYYVLRVDLGEGACLHCTHEPPTEALEPALSRLTGLSTEDILSLRKNNGRFTLTHVSTMRSFCERNKIPLPKVGERFSDWLVDHCGEIRLPVQNVTVPIPHATILPGILIAGEIIKERHYNAYKLSNMYVQDIFSIPSKGYRTHLAPREDCQFCRNERVMNRYSEKHLKVLDK